MNGHTGPYLSLLMAIQEDPLSTVSDLVSRVKGSKPTIIKRLKYLRENQYFWVQALLNNHNLGFEAVDVLLDTHSLDDVKRLEQVVTNHPYTVYRSRCFGSHNGLFVQFRTPIGTRPLVEELVRLLHEEGVVSNGQIFSMGRGPTVRSSMKLEAWSPESMTWRFDWKDWFERDCKKVRVVRPRKNPGSALKWFNTNDVYILQQLMIDAKRPQTEMIRAIKKKGPTITPQTFGRRLRLIRRECVEKYRVAFNPRAFDIITNILVRGRGSKKFLQDLYSRMSTNPIPFESTLRTADHDLFWAVRMPPSHLSSLLTNLHGNLEDMSVTLLDYSQSFLYSIWPATLNEEAHEWRQDREFMIDQALKK
ncbi:MAG: hypothetical protein ACTSV3_05335 [Candidatus Thorarchaeota archaeon]|nr:MAG: hypothetical protein DRP09_06390 [Candidatus Thorarchaeota archaeon]RLI58480.1 MAG: hypothetical protein DRO87_05565 [Candidatus Thorarchaeota archaeon]